jgi:ribosomal 50S subunit-associated protein YjgA (DUF615 family)
MSAVDVREEIIALAQRGTDLAAIEREVIERVPISDDERAALWLLAWYYASEAPRRWLSSS